MLVIHKQYVIRRSKGSQLETVNGHIAGFDCSKGRSRARK